MASSPSINSIADRVPELLFRLQYGDDRAALQLDFISKSQPLLRKMMEKGDDITSSLGVILALSEKKNAAWLKKTLPTIRRQGKLLGPMLQAAMKLLGVRILATDGGDARKAKFSDTIIGRGNKPALYVRKKVELAAMSAKNAKLESEGLRKEIDDAKPSADEIRETLKSIPAEEREKRRKELKDMGLPFSNEYLAATFINGTEEKHTWQVNAAYAILTRKDIKREHPPGAAGIKAHISECLDSGDLLNIVGVWGGFKDNAEGRADAADRMALELIEETVGMLKQIGVESKVTLYFADLHAISPFFGRDLSYVAKSDNYRADMLKLADGIGFEFVPVTEAVYGFSMYNLKRALDPKKYPKEGLIYLGKGVEGELIARGKGIWDNLNQEAKDEVLRAIGRYTSPEVRKEKGEEWLAILYLGNRAFEGAWIGEVHRGGVFFSYGRPLYEIQPGYTIFWHSLKGGINKPPWFIDAEKELK